MNISAEDVATAVVPAVGRDVPVVWGHVPQRNKFFTGREKLLDDLHREVSSDPGEVTAVLAHALHGLGGVGKTQLACEYVHRYASSYQVVWWISADQIALVRSALAALAPRLGLPPVQPGRLDDAVDGVLEALRLGRPYSRWLLVFDNAEEPEKIRDLIPRGPGHVIVTSRNHGWGTIADTVEVDVFRRPESSEFLARRLPGVPASEAGRLAQELGDLPLALEQAAALLAESGMPVEEYLVELASEAGRVLAINPPTDYPRPVAAAFALSMSQVERNAPDAWELLRRCAFFGPEPIRRDLLKDGRLALGSPLGDVLKDSIRLSEAIRWLGKLALARVDSVKRTIQVHRLIQLLIRDGMETDDADSMRHEVHLVLAAADPDDPGEITTWGKYAELLAHIAPAKVTASTDAEVRRLARNMVEYLFRVGDLRAANELSRDALALWQQRDPGTSDFDRLSMGRLRADVLWARGEYQVANELRSVTIDAMRNVLGERHPETIWALNGHGADLRVQGDFSGALDLDRSTNAIAVDVLGEDDELTLRIANNLALDQGLTSDYAGALLTDRRTHASYQALLGQDNHPLVVHSLSAIGRDLRQAGAYREALTIEEEAYQAFQDIVDRGIINADHPFVLLQAKDLSVVQRKMGQLEPALKLAKAIHGRFLNSYGPLHSDTLAAAMNLGNAQRVLGDFSRDTVMMEQADRQIEDAYDGYQKLYGEDHPYTHGCALNLAIVRRRVGDSEGALALLQAAHVGLDARLGSDHHYTLTCRTALATSLAEVGDKDAAVATGEAAMEGLRKVVGEDHPHTLACSVNLSIDLRTVGRAREAKALSEGAVTRYRRILDDDHFDVLDAASGERIALDFEPPPL